MSKRSTVYLLFTVVCTGISVGAQAQNTFQSEWAIGASAGVNFSSVSFRPQVLKNTLTGYNGGITARWITEKNLGLQLEINFKQQGWSEAIDETKEQIINPYYIRRMTYLDIPLFTHIYFGSDKARFFINLGPQIGCFIDETSSQNLNGATVINRPNEQHTMPVEKKIEWGLGGGPGIELRSAVGYFLLEGRYYYALSDFYNTRRGDAFSKASSQVIAVKFTYLIPLRK